MTQSPAQIAYCAKLDAACERVVQELIAEFGAEKAATMDPMMHLNYDELTQPSPAPGTYMKALY